MSDARIRMGATPSQQLYPADFRDQVLVPSSGALLHTFSR